MQTRPALPELRAKVESFFEGYNKSKEEKVQFIYDAKVKGRNPGYQLTVTFPRQPEEKEEDEKEVAFSQQFDQSDPKGDGKEEKAEKGDNGEKVKEEGSFNHLAWKMNHPGPTITLHPVKYFIKLQLLCVDEITVYLFLQYSGLGPEEVYFFPIKVFGSFWLLGVVTKDVATADEPLKQLPSEVNCSFLPLFS